MTRAKDISKIVTDANLSGTLDVAGELQVGVDGTTAGLIRLMDSGSVTEEATISTDANGGLIFGGNSGPGELIFRTGSSTKRMDIDSGGDISFYEDTGTTPKFFWDASEERLGIGNSSPTNVLEISANATNFGMLINNTSTGNPARITLTNSEGSGYIDQNNNLLRFNQSGSTDVAIDSSGNVGIGTDSPASYSSLANNLVVQDTAGEGGITVVSTNTGSSNIFFADTDSAVQGQIKYQHSGDYMRFYTVGTEAMRIDSSQNLLVGTTDESPYNNNAGSSADNGISLRGSLGKIEVARYNSTPFEANRTGTDGDILSLRKNGSPVGSIGNRFNALYVHSPDGTNGSGLRFADGLIQPCESNGNDSNGDTDLGQINSKFKDLYLSGGVYLGGTGSANHLDDYEEGTWTATLSEGTCTTAHASYTKIGRRVHVSAQLNTFSDRSSPSSVEIQGLPFARDTSKDEVAGGPAMWSYVDEANTVAYIATSGLQFYTSQSGNFTSLRYADLNNSASTVYFVATYYST